MNFRRKIAIILTFAMVTSLFTLNIASVFAETAGEEDSGTTVAEEQSGADQTTEVPSEQATEPEP